jgi:flavin-dependent dehydrogenase
MQSSIEPNIYDCAIIGGGLAGLCLSIQLAKANKKVILFEKNTYPFHKVCGEYVSLESWNFLESLGLNLSEMNLPIIRNIRVSAENGFKIESKLDLGGFGISRFKLDHELYKIAINQGVVIHQACTVTSVNDLNDSQTIQSTLGSFKAKIVCGSYGKLTPTFINDNHPNSKGIYVAVKYHIKTNLALDVIELHNFKNGYCGISKIEEDKYCLCYLTTTLNLNAAGNDIKEMERKFLYQNPKLKKYFLESEFLFQKPLAISKISLNKKFTDHQNIFMLGDAAGAIAPLCGNGMSMAMKASKLLSENLILFFDNKLSKESLLSKYNQQWNNSFSMRIQVGFYLQKLFGKKYSTLFALKMLSVFPRLFSKIISLTHGEIILTK